MPEPMHSSGSTNTFTRRAQHAPPRAARRLELAARRRDAPAAGPTVSTPARRSPCAVAGDEAPGSSVLGDVDAVPRRGRGRPTGASTRADRTRSTAAARTARRSRGAAAATASPWRIAMSQCSTRIVRRRSAGCSQRAQSPGGEHVGSRGAAGGVGHDRRRRARSPLPSSHSTVGRHADADHDRVGPQRAAVGEDDAEPVALAPACRRPGVPHTTSTPARGAARPARPATSSPSTGASGALAASTSVTGASRATAAEATSPPMKPPPTIARWRDARERVVQRGEIGGLAQRSTPGHVERRRQHRAARRCRRRAGRTRARRRRRARRAGLDVEPGRRATPRRRSMSASAYASAGCGRGTARRAPPRSMVLGEQRAVVGRLAPRR